MAIYRHVHVEFWKDPKVLEELTPEDKLFFIYLLTNPNTTQIGVYKITKKQIAFELGLLIIMGLLSTIMILVRYVLRIGESII